MPPSMRYSGFGLAATFAYKRWRRGVATRGCERTPGRCPVCERGTVFLHVDDNAREGALCSFCGSVPRQRALTQFLRRRFVDTFLRVHESSPSLCSYRFFRRHAREYVASYFWQGQSHERVGCFVNVDLCSDQMKGRDFSLVVTQDVFEHVSDPERALRSVHESLRPGGVHVFTIPRDRSRKTRTRCTFENGEVRHLESPEYHRDPIAGEGALVVTDWGDDTCELVAKATGGECEVRTVRDDEAGVFADVEVFVSYRAPRRLPS